MVIISNQILIDFIRLNNRAVNIPNDQLGKLLNRIIEELGGVQNGRTPNGRENEDGQPLGFPKSSMNYILNQNQLQTLFTKILNEIF
jgi:hypothetical protein